MLRALLRPGLEVYDQRDETLFHLPTIQGFARALPLPDLSDYPSATGPLYHLLLAPLAAASGEDLLLLRLATLGLSLGLLAFAALLLAGRVQAPTPALGLALLPLALSPYVIGPAVRLSTDNVALLGVVACLWALDRAPPPPSWRALLLAALFAAAATLTRQVHGWLVGLLVLAALPRSALPSSTGPRLARLLPAAIPVLALAPLVLLWGGLTPPSFAEHQGGLDPHIGLTELAVLGGLALPWAPWLWAERSAPLALGSLALGAALLLLSPIPWVEDPLRYGGSLWRLASFTPELLGSTGLFWLLVPAGLLAMASLLRRAWRTGDVLPGAALLLFFVANLASARGYQKYYEPFFLLVLAWACTRGPQPGRWAWIGPALLALAWLAVALVRFAL